MEAAGQPNTQRGRLARRFTVATASQTQRRRMATVFAVAVAGMLGYHAFFGANGVSAYHAKQVEDRVLSKQLEQMKQENSRLKSHVEHLKTDPAAIEYEAQKRLRYTRRDQVIVLNNAPASAPNNASSNAQKSTPAVQ